MSVATMTTNHGDITIELFDEDAPKTVANFRKLAEDGFYDGLGFHRIIEGFMIQGGCPLGTGTGGPGYTFDDEPHPELQFNEPYLLAMANAGVRPNPITGKPAGTNGSQFFITVSTPDYLNNKHTIFGKVADDDSKAVVDKIANTPTERDDRPVEDIMITGVTIS